MLLRTRASEFLLIRREMPPPMWAPPIFSKGSFYTTVIPSATRLKRFTGRRRKGQPKDKMPSRPTVFTSCSSAEEIHGALPLEKLRHKRMLFNKVVSDHIVHFSEEQKSPTLSRVMVSLLKDLRAEVNGAGELRRTEGVHSDFIKFLVEKKREETRRNFLNSS